MRADPKVRGHRYFLEMFSVGVKPYPKYDNIVAQSVTAQIAKFVRNISYIESSIIF